MIRYYGTEQCVNCRELAQACAEKGVEAERMDIGDLKTLKAFMRLRDFDPAFDGFKAEGKLGIPCIVGEDGSLTFDWKSLPELA